MKVFGIISDERAFRSKSPAMHNGVLRRMGLDGVYVPFKVEPDRLEQAIAGLRALNIAGANVTVPYKERVMPFLDEFSEQAAKIGAVNTIAREGDRLVGHNTDAPGFLEALDGLGFEPRGRTAWVFGAGGAAKAVGYALVQAGARVNMAGRDLAKTARTAGPIHVTPTTMVSCACAELAADLIVNATSVSDPAESPEMNQLLGRLRPTGCGLVYDLNYGRAENMWRDLADRIGASFEDGLFMLAHQARLSFQIWTGLDVPVGEFAQGLRG